jgi:hypothetical protein
MLDVGKEYTFGFAEAVLLVMYAWIALKRLRVVLSTTMNH